MQELDLETIKNPWLIEPSWLYIICGYEIDWQVEPKIKSTVSVWSSFFLKTFSTLYPKVSKATRGSNLESVQFIHHI